MGLIYRRRIRTGARTFVNLSKSGASVTRKVGAVSLNSRGRVTVRLARGLSWRIGGK